MNNNINKHWNKNMTNILGNACFVAPVSIYTEAFLFSRVYFNYLRT